MNNTLNQDLYSRFGLNLKIEQVQDGCKKYLKGEIIDALGPVMAPSAYDDKVKLWSIQSVVLDEVCRQLFLDVEDWYEFGHKSGLERLIENEISDSFSGTFNEYLLRLQVLLNVVSHHKFVSYELKDLAERIDKYFADFAVLGVTIKIYKKKAPQIFPTTSKKFEHEIKNTLGLLETDKKYIHVLEHYESGLKEFMVTAKQADLKDAIEDMYTACDELVKTVTKDNGKGLRHISDKQVAPLLALNGHQKELFKNFRNWIDEIKHGTIKKFDRNDVEMIITMTGSLIRFVISKQG